jgi:hypothetical protein
MTPTKLRGVHSNLPLRKNCFLAKVDSIALESLEVIEQYFGVNYHTIANQTLCAEFFVDAIREQVHNFTIFKNNLNDKVKSERAYLDLKCFHH